MSGTASGLTTRGRCLLAAGIATALCSLLLDERDLLRVGVLVAVLPLLAIVITRRSRVALGAERTVDPARVPVGSTAEVRLTVHRRSPWGVGGLQLEDGVADAVGAPGGVPPRFTLTRLPRTHPVELVYPLRPTLRGRHRVGPLSARLTDPFGLAEVERELAPAGQLTVVPRVVGLRHVLPGSGGWSVAGGAGAATDRHGQGEVDVAVRPYRQGDEPRRVHWRSTAHRDELMVRLEERPRRGGVTVLLDRRAVAHRGDGPYSSLEWAVTMAASLCVHLIERGESVELVTEGGVRVSPGGGVDGVLDGLATLRTSARYDLAAPAPPVAGGDSDGVIAVLGALGTADLRQLRQLRDAAPLRSAHAVLLDVGSWAGAIAGRDIPETPDVAAGAVQLRAAGWSVTVVGAGTGPDQAWQELVGAGEVRR